MEVDVFQVLFVQAAKVRRREALAVRGRLQDRRQSRLRGRRQLARPTLREQVPGRRKVLAEDRPREAALPPPLGAEDEFAGKVWKSPGTPPIGVGGGLPPLPPTCCHTSRGSGMNRCASANASESPDVGLVKIRGIISGNFFQYATPTKQ